MLAVYQGAISRHKYGNKSTYQGNKKCRPIELYCKILKLTGNYNTMR